ncbi:MAG: response regulator [Pseudobutyrivibrio sp.]|nr:response regulator [Pseudobutyrivibrio sp.]
MADRTNRHIIVNGIITISVLGLMIESIFEGWEFWVPPLLFAGIIALWVLHITEAVSERFREDLSLAFALMASFFHGVHESSFFDVVIITLLLFVTFTLLIRQIMLDMIFLEYVVVMIIQFILAFRDPEFTFSGLNISRCVLHICAALCAYFASKKIVNLGKEAEMQQAELANLMKNTAKEREDFLANISHELRTPINVVNGMSTLILKTEDRKDVEAIRAAGFRLARQVEDIQDYTELQRQDFALEENNYIITSLINDVITGFNLQEKSDYLDFVIDLDPAVPTMLRGDIKKLHKILRHVIDNAIKFTSEGGIYFKVSCIKKDYGVNLIIVITDTGVGMSRKDLFNVSRGLYQANKKRNRSTGGIGLGLAVVYGFVRAMNGFVKVESEKKSGTTVSISIPQKVIDPKPCLELEESEGKNILFYYNHENYAVPALRDFYRTMAIHLAEGLKFNLYSAEEIVDVKNCLKKVDITNIFLGQKCYMKDAKYFDELSHSGIDVAVTAPMKFRPGQGSNVILVPKPLYGFSVVRVLNGGRKLDDIAADEETLRPIFENVKVLVVDDEPMNLVVATGLFRDYKMITDTADSGKEAIKKFASNDYDIIFMDHMMPEMDGVEAMKLISEQAKVENRQIINIALTANVVSGAREMFIREGFDAVINKPIDIRDFERTMTKVLPQSRVSYERRTVE